MTAPARRAARSVRPGSDARRRVLCLYRPSFLASLEYRVYDTLVRSRRRGRRAAGSSSWTSTNAACPRSASGRGVAISSATDRRLRDLGASDGRARHHLRGADRYDGSSGTPTTRRSPTRSATGRVVLGYALTFDAADSGVDRVRAAPARPCHRSTRRRGSGRSVLPRDRCHLQPARSDAGRRRFRISQRRARSRRHPRRVPLLMEFDGRVYPGARARRR